MRVALAADGTRGDVHPLLALGEGFRRLGHDVRVCAPPNFREDAESRGLEFASVGRSTREFLKGCAGVVTGGGLGILRETRSFAREALAAQLEAVPEQSRGSDLIVAAGVQAGARVAADLHRIPYRFVAYCPALIPSPDLTPVSLPTRPLPRWINRVAWRATALMFDQLMLRMINDRLAQGGQAPARHAIDYVLGEHPVLAADRELAPAAETSRVPIEQIPCLHPFDGPPLPEKLERFLDSGPPPVFLGFGSMTDPDPAATTRELLEGVGAAGLRAVISKGWAGLADGALPDGVFATGPVAHARLFPRMAAVVHHGGAGTTTMAARAGVPQVLVPHLLDQFYWASRVSALGIGPPHLPRNRLTGTRLAEILTSIRDNEVLHDRADEIGRRLREGLEQAPDPATRLLPR
jgi:vancomycin aglycone glucosyltransferase